MKVARKKPRELTASWPDEPSPDVVGEVARLFAINLRDAIGSRSVRAVSAECNVSHATVLHIISGEIYPDLTSMARLEQGLQIVLWPALSAVTIDA